MLQLSTFHNRRGVIYSNSSYIKVIALSYSQCVCFMPLFAVFLLDIQDMEEMGITYYGNIQFRSVKGDTARQYRDV